MSLSPQGESYGFQRQQRLEEREHMVDHVDMISLFAVLGVFGANAALSSRFGADSRRTDDRRNW